MYFKTNHIKITSILLIIIFIISQLSGIKENSPEKSGNSGNPHSSEYVESFKEYALLEDAKKTSGFAMKIPSFMPLEGKKIFARKNELRVEYYGDRERIIIIKSKNMFNTLSIPCLKSKVVDNKRLFYYGIKTPIICRWFSDGYYYQIKAEKNSIDPALFATLVDETDKKDIPVPEQISEEDLTALGVSIETQGSIKRISDYPCEVENAYQAKQVIQSLFPVLGVPETELQLFHITTLNGVFVCFSQVLGDITVGFNKVSVYCVDGKATVVSNYHKVENLDRTSRITEDKAIEISNLKDITSIRKTIYTDTNRSVIAYCIIGRDKIIYVSALDGTLLREETKVGE